MCLIVPAAIVAMGNHTVVKNGTIELYCYVSGTPPATVLWTHVKSGKTWNQKKWTVSDIQVEELGEYRCNASNKYGGDIKSTFILYEGGWVKLIWEMLRLQNVKKLFAGIAGLLVNTYLLWNYLEPGWPKSGMGITGLWVQHIFNMVTALITQNYLIHNVDIPEKYEGSSKTLSKF